MTDLSREGVGIHLEKPMAIGTKVVASLSLDEKIMLRGCVMWILNKPGDNFFNYMAGVEIDAIIYPEIEALGYLEKHLLFEEVLSAIVESGGTMHEKAS